MPDVKLVSHNLCQEKGEHPKIHNLYDLHLGETNIEKLDLLSTTSTAVAAFYGLVLVE